MKEDWASEKVRVFIKASKEKATLMALARVAQPDGTGIFLALGTIASDTGQSIRTVRRHLRALEARGELVTFPQASSYNRTNEYYIPICRETAAEIEARTGISRQQLKLPLAQRDQARVFVTNTGSVCPPKPDKMTALPGQNDRQSSPYHTNNNKKPLVFMKKKEREAIKLAKQEDPDASIEISPETQARIADTLAKLRPVDAPGRRPDLHALSEQARRDREAVAAEPGRA